LLSEVVYAIHINFAYRRKQGGTAIMSSLLWGAIFFYLFCNYFLKGLIEYIK